MCLALAACGKKDSEETQAETQAETYLSLEELLADPEFQQILADNEDEYFSTSVSAIDSSTMLFRVDAKKTYEGDDLEFYHNLTAEEISDKFGLEDLQKMFKTYGLGDVTIEYKMYNGDGALMNEQTYGSSK